MRGWDEERDNSWVGFNTIYKRWEPVRGDGNERGPERKKLPVLLTPPRPCLS